MHYGPGVRSWSVGLPNLECSPQRKMAAKCHTGLYIQKLSSGQPYGHVLYTHGSYWLKNRAVRSLLKDLEELKFTVWSTRKMYKQEPLDERIHRNRNISELHELEIRCGFFCARHLWWNLRVIANATKRATSRALFFGCTFPQTSSDGGSDENFGGFRTEMFKSVPKYKTNKTCIISCEPLRSLKMYQTYWAPRMRVESCGWWSEMYPKRANRAIEQAPPICRRVWQKLAHILL